MNIHQLNPPYPVLWRGKTDDKYGVAAIIGITAITLKMTHKADSVDEEKALAQEM